MSCDAELADQEINRRLVSQLADYVLVGKPAFEPLCLIGLDSLAPFDPYHRAPHVPLVRQLF